MRRRSRAAFAVVSLVLGAVGVYGVTSYVIGQRTREIGIRLALGAERRRVIHEVLLKGMTPVAIGVVLGGVGALATGRAASGLLYGVSPHDPATFGGVVAFLFVVALMACWVPARRAAHVDPTESLRQD